MDQTIITTNLRIPKSDWLQMRVLASEAQMSLNEYLKYIIDLVSRAKQFSVSWKKIPLKPVKKDPIWDWPNLAKKIKSQPMGLSAEDEIIYG